MRKTLDLSDILTGLTAMAGFDASNMKHYVGNQRKNPDLVDQFRQAAKKGKNPLSVRAAPELTICVPTKANH
jgi:hypothetical protein